MFMNSLKPVHMMTGISGRLPEDRQCQLFFPFLRGIG
jgi:hypothetical protein